MSGGKSKSLARERNKVIKGILWVEFVASLLILIQNRAKFTRMQGAKWISDPSCTPFFFISNTERMVSNLANYKGQAILSSCKSEVRSRPQNHEKTIPSADQNVQNPDPCCCSSTFTRTAQGVACVPHYNPQQSSITRSSSDHLITQLFKLRPQLT